MARPPHEWNSTDIALYGMGKMDMTDAEMRRHLPVGGLGPDAEAVAAMREANWTPAVQYWRQKHSEARAEIERLEKEVERLAFDNKAKAIQIEMHSGMAEDARQQRDTARNDAIEAAAVKADTDVRGPDGYLMRGIAMDIRALKRPTPATEASHE